MTDNQASGPRFPGYREMNVGEVLADCDMYYEMHSSGRLVPTQYAGGTIPGGSEGCYFRPIPVTPAAAPRADGITDDTEALQAIQDKRAAPIISKTEITTEPKADPEGAGPAPASYPTPWIKDHAGAAIEINSADGENVIHMRLCTNDPEKEEAADRIISAVNSHATLTAALAKAREALAHVFGILCDAPELNMSNYDVEEVSALNDKMIEGFLYLDDLRGSLKFENPAALGNLEQKEGSK